jgi:hypothetical protein
MDHRLTGRPNLVSLSLEGLNISQRFERRYNYSAVKYIILQASGAAVGCDQRTLEQPYARKVTKDQPTAHQRLWMPGQAKMTFI